jgi:hypothetical protein
MKNRVCRRLVWFITTAQLLPADQLVAAQSEQSQCGLFLAPSSIPGAGLGIFAGDRRFAQGETVGMGDLVIPIVDHGDWEGGFFLWDEYTWSVGEFEHIEDEVDEDDYVSVASPGLGAAPNGYSSLFNVEDEWSTEISRAMDGTSPGVGAITPHHDRSWKATTDIPPGAEIFLK